MNDQTIQPIATGRRVYPPKIAKALLAITSAIGAIAKTGKNTEQNYFYMTWEDINDRLQPLLVEHGLLLEQQERDISVIEHQGGAILRITYDMTWVSTEGEAWPAKPWTAMCKLGTSKGFIDDKAAPKCHTQAEKYFCIKQFKIRVDDGSQDSDAGDAREQEPEKPRERKSSGEPRVLGKGRGSADFLRMFTNAIAGSATVEQVSEWQRLNADLLAALEKAAPKHHQACLDACRARIDEIAPKADPTPAPDAGRETTSDTPPASTSSAAPSATSSPAAPTQPAGTAAPASRSDGLDIPADLRREPEKPKPPTVAEVTERVERYAGGMAALDKLVEYSNEIEGLMTGWGWADGHKANIRAIFNRHIKRVQDAESAKVAASKTLPDEMDLSLDDGGFDPDRWLSGVKAELAVIVQAAAPLMPLTGALRNQVCTNILAVRDKNFGVRSDLAQKAAAADPEIYNSAKTIYLETLTKLGLK